MDDATGQQSNTLTFSVIEQVVDTPFFVPFFRLYKGANKDHLYTTNPEERDKAIAEGYTYERIEGSISNRNATGMVPLYRLLYNDGTKKDHFYTTSVVEKDAAIANSGYVTEGIAGYVYENSVPGAVAMYRLYSAGDKDHFYCIRKSEKDFVDNNPAWSFNYEKIACYVMPSESTVPLAGGRPSGHYGSANTATGAFKFSKSFLSFPSPGPSLNFAISYDSSSTNNSIIGTGWTHTYDWRIYETEDHYIAHRGSGRLDYYDHGSLNQTSGAVYNSLTKAGDVLTLTTPEKLRYEFGYLSTLDEDKKKGFYLKKIIDRYNNQLTLSYLSGQIETITDPVGRSITFAYDNNNHLNSITDNRLGRTISFSVDNTAKNLLWYTDMMGRKTSFDYEVISGSAQSHRVIKIIDPLGVTQLTNLYDSQGRLINQTDALNNLTTYSYTADKTIITDPLGNQTSHDNNSNYELQAYTDPLSNSASYKYTDHELSEVKDKKDHVSIYGHNSLGGLTGTDHVLENSDHITTSYVYGNENFPAFPTRYTDTMSESTTYSYDVKGSLETVTDPLGNNVSKTYYPNGQIHTLTDKNSRTTTYTYGDADKNLTQITIPLSGSVNYAYDDAGRRISRTDSRGFTTSYQYDDNNNLIKTIDPYSNETVNTYDQNNRLIKERDAKNNVTDYTYDDKGQLLTRISSQGLITAYTYDAVGRRTSVTDPAGKKTNYSYDGNSNLIKITSTTTQNSTPISTVNFEYDANGNLYKVIDDHGNVVQNEYDEMDRLANTKDPLNKVTHYSYYNNGNVFTRLDAKGVITEYFYDKLGRLKKISYPNSTSIDFVYDNNGNLTSMTDPAGQTIFTYDMKNRLSSVNDPFGNLVSYGYDTEDNRTSMTYPGNKTVSYEYDKLNRLVKVTDWLGGATDYQYDNVGNVTRISNANNTYAILTYDNDNRLISLGNYKPDNAVISSYDYTLDQAGNIIEINSVEPLQPVEPSVSISYTYNAANQIISDGTNTYAYDNNGNLQQRNGSQTATFGYNYENLLTSISGSVNLTNIYNGLGMRLAGSQNGVQTRYILDTASSLPGVLAETDASNSINTYYVYGLGLISRVTPSGIRQTYHFNHRGDTVALTDVNGNVIDTYAYDEYGKMCNSTGSTKNPFKYVGRYGVMYEGNDFYFMRARYYCANTGKFLSKDPIGFEGGDWNLYAYGGGNPLLSIDPDGKFVSAALAVIGVSKIVIDKVSSFLTAEVIIEEVKMHLEKIQYYDTQQYNLVLKGEEGSDLHKKIVESKNYEIQKIHQIAKKHGTDWIEDIPQYLFSQYSFLWDILKPLAKNSITLKDIFYSCVGEGCNK
ncbi:MAG: RHS repeat-associated core domain-containing protein [Desulfobacula sp.]